MSKSLGYSNYFNSYSTPRQTVPAIRKRASRENIGKNLPHSRAFSGARYMPKRSGYPTGEASARPSGTEAKKDAEKPMKYGFLTNDQADSQAESSSCEEPFFGEDLLDADWIGDETAEPEPGDFYCEADDLED